MLMARSEKRLRMRREKFEKKKIRRREQFMRCEDKADISSNENNSFKRLESRRRCERRLIREAIIRFVVSIAAIIVICYFVAKFIADKI